MAQHEGDRGWVPMSDSQVAKLVGEMQKCQLGTDQRALATSALRGRSVTCHQAGVMLGVLRLGIIQRGFAREVLRGRLSDAPAGLPEALAPLTGLLRADVADALGGAPHGSCTPSACSAGNVLGSTSRTSSTCASATDHATLQPGGAGRWGATDKQSDWIECLERLRARMADEAVSAPFYRDVSAVFDTFGLRPLPPQSARDRAVAPPPGRGSGWGAAEGTPRASSCQAAAGVGRHSPAGGRDSLFIAPEKHLIDADAGSVHEHRGASRSSRGRHSKLRDARDAETPLPGQVLDPDTPRSSLSEESV